MKNASLVLIDRQPVLPVSSNDMKERLRLDDAVPLTEADIYQRATVNYIFARYGIDLFLSSQWDLLMPEFPCGDIVLPVWPVTSINSVQYWQKSSGFTLTTFGNPYLKKEREPKVTYADPATSWPTDELKARPDAVRVRFNSGAIGFYNSAVPEDLITAIILLTGHFIENRQAVSDRAMVSLPMGFEYLMAPYEINHAP